MICPENYYCNNGKKFECPAKTVTDGTGAKTQTECKTCYDLTKNSATAGYKDGVCVDCYTESSLTPAWGGEELGCTSCLLATGEATPAYSETAGGCVSCAEAYPDRPIWNPDTKVCFGCPSKTPVWTGTECIVAVVSTPVGDLKIMEVFSPKTPVLDLKTSCTAMISDTKYPEVTACNEEDDEYWAGCVKYCRDRGMRLPTMQELAYIGEEIYNTSGWDPYAKYTGLTTVNQELRNTLIAATIYESVGYAYFWSSELSSSGNAYERGFSQDTSIVFISNRTSSNTNVMCIAD